MNGVNFVWGRFCDNNILKKVQNIPDRFWVVIVLFYSILGPFLWRYSTILLYNRFNTTSSNNMTFPSASLCNFSYTLFYKDQENWRWLSVTIFQRWSGSKMFLVFSYLKSAYSALATACAISSMVYMWSLLLSKIVDKTYINFHILLFFN